MEKEREGKAACKSNEITATPTREAPTKNKKQQSKHKQ